MNDQKKAGGLGKGCLIVVGVLAGWAAIGSIVGPDKHGRGQTTSSAQSGAEQSPPSNLAPSGGEVSKEGEAAPSLTGPQNNAARSAEQYLSIQGFSRKGLIFQLSSGAGDGYSVEDATAAVDSLTVDWNENAAKSAKQYLSMQGFSCHGLIEQLSSSAGDKYTPSQASYGAHQAGAC